jgi:hypothetical protein
MNAETNVMRINRARALGALTSLVFTVLLTACGGSDEMPDSQASSASGTTPSLSETSVSPDSAAAKRE